MKLLWVGDAACDSGFARATHETLSGFIARGWEVAVLGLNYRGDPHNYPYPIYPAMVPRGDVFGWRRVAEIARREQPHVVVLQNDPWNIPGYTEPLNGLKHRPFVVGAIAVDGKLCNGKALEGLDHAIFWTKFGQQEAQLGGYRGASDVVPLGVDTAVFCPGDREVAWARLQLPAFTRKGFFFLNVNRNQPRKHLGLTMEAYAEFYHGLTPRERWADPFLYLHVSPTGDLGVNLDRLGGYYNLHRAFILSEPDVYKASSLDDLVATYRRADAQLTTTQGEGWGLTTMEGMACGVPQIVPDWSALGEWASPASFTIPCDRTSVTPGATVIGGLPNHAELVSAMRQLYFNKPVCEKLVARGLELVNRPEFRWSNIGAAFATAVETAYANRR